MRLFAAAGQPTAALAQFDTSMHVLHEELGERPAEATAALADEIRHDTTAATPTAATSGIGQQLPLGSSSFVGRDAELAGLDERFADPSCRLVTIVGVGGVGKTRLAVEFARAWEDGDGTDRSAVFVSFAGVAPVVDRHIDEAMVTTLAAALGIALVPGRDPFAVLVEGIARQSDLLLVVDNLEHLADAGRVVARVLDAAPRLQALATSRRRLAIGAEWVVPLHGLAVPETDDSAETSCAPAVRLFCERADAAGAERDLDPVQVGALCRALGGIPLAIELAARRAATVPVRDILSRLDTSLDLLEGGFARPRPAFSLVSTPFGPGQLKS